MKKILFILFVCLNILTLAQVKRIPVPVPKDQSQTPGAVLMFFDETTNTFKFVTKDDFGGSSGSSFSNIFSNTWTTGENDTTLTDANEWVLIYNNNLNEPFKQFMFQAFGTDTTNYWLKLSETANWNQIYKIDNNTIFTLPINGTKIYVKSNTPTSKCRLFVWR